MPQKLSAGIRLIWSLEPILWPNFNFFDPNKLTDNPIRITSTVNIVNCQLKYAI